MSIQTNIKNSDKFLSISKGEQELTTKHEKQFAPELTHEIDKIKTLHLPLQVQSNSPSTEISKLFLVKNIKCDGSIPKVTTLKSPISDITSPRLFFQTEVINFKYWDSTSIITSIEKETHKAGVLAGNPFFGKDYLFKKCMSEVEILLISMNEKEGNLFDTSLFNNIFELIHDKKIKTLIIEDTKKCFAPCFSYQTKNYIELAEKAGDNFLFLCLESPYDLAISTNLLQFFYAISKKSEDVELLNCYYLWNDALIKKFQDNGYLLRHILKRKIDKTNFVTSLHILSISLNDLMKRTNGVLTLHLPSEHLTITSEDIKSICESIKTRNAGINEIIFIDSSKAKIKNDKYIAEFNNHLNKLGIKVSYNAKIYRK